MRIGVVLGGSKLEAAALDEAGGVVLRRRFATSARDWDGTLAAICRVVAESEAVLVPSDFANDANCFALTEAIDGEAAGTPGRWGACVSSDRVATRLVPPRHGDSSGVRGAAWRSQPGEAV